MKWPDSLPSQPRPPASEQEIDQFVKTVFASLNSDEQEEAARYDQLVGRGIWQFPIHPLPESYLNFLRFSNGGYFEGTHHDLNLYSTHEVREMLLGYCVIRWMPGVCNFGGDGCGNLYLFDMRQAPINGDYPIWLVHAGDLDFEDAWQIAESFAELIRTALGD